MMMRSANWTKVLIDLPGFLENKTKSKTPLSPVTRFPIKSLKHSAEEPLLERYLKLLIGPDCCRVRKKWISTEKVQRRHDVYF